MCNLKLHIFTFMNINQYIDHTLLKANATENDIVLLCDEAIQYQFYAVCVNPCWINLCKQLLINTDIKIASVVGFPLGANDTIAKVFEAEQCVLNGADEIDMVMNVGRFLSKNYSYIEQEILSIKQKIDTKILKVIIETCYLTEEEIAIASKICSNNGADFVKTSTGFGTRGASLNDIKIIKENIHSSIKIKASGGIKTTQDALDFIALGVSRIGTSSCVLMMNNVNYK